MSAFSLGKTWISCAAVLVCTAAGARTAAAEQGLAACGDVQLQARAECEVVPPGVDCNAKCTPVALRAACDVRIAADCRASCDKLPSVTCSGDCSASCAADCDKLDPGSFDCEGSCNADCSGRCAADCKANADQAACEASCSGSCGASCSASCKGTPPMVECNAGCKASCQGSCEVDANVACQVDCQASARGDCEAELEGGCKVACKGHDGALFCDGQYVDYGDNLQTCVEALKAVINANVRGEAESQGSCSGSACSGSAKAKVSSKCAVSDPGIAGSGGAFCGFFALFVLSRLRRRALHV